MKAKELHEEWSDGGTGLRPKRIQRLRDEIAEHTGLFVPRSVRAIESWLPRFKGQVTRKLREAKEAAEEEVEEDSSEIAATDDETNDEQE